MFQPVTYRHFAVLVFFCLALPHHRGQYLTDMFTYARCGFMVDSRSTNHYMFRFYSLQSGLCSRFNRYYLREGAGIVAFLFWVVSFHAYAGRDLVYHCALLLYSLLLRPFCYFCELGSKFLSTI